MKHLKTTLTMLCILTLTALAFPISSFAEIPRTINYQGKLTNPSGTPVADGTYTITFRIYEQESGGSPLWSETQTITAQKGIFSTQIGATKDLNLAFDKPYFLGIQVGTDTEMSPRQALSSAAYTFRAEKANEAILATTATTLTDTTKLIPSGVIVMWSGSAQNIPAGWVLCDGTNGTPDLRNKFVLGAGGLANVGNKRNRNLTGSGDDIRLYVQCGARAEGGQQSPEPHQDYMPPYYALAYIMKK